MSLRPSGQTDVIHSRPVVSSMVTESSGVSNQCSVSVVLTQSKGRRCHGVQAGCSTHNQEALGVPTPLPLSQWLGFTLLG